MTVSRGDILVFILPPVIADIIEGGELSMRSSTLGEILEPCNRLNGSRFRRTDMSCWLNGSSTDGNVSVTIRNQTYSDIYELSITLQNKNICRLMMISVTVVDKEPICTTIYRKSRSGLRLSCKWDPLDLHDRVYLLAGDRIYERNVTSIIDVVSHLTDEVSTTVPLEDLFSIKEKLPDRCAVIRNGVNMTCKFSIFMEPKEKAFTLNGTRNSAVFTCCPSYDKLSSMSIWFYDQHQTMPSFDLIKHPLRYMIEKPTRNTQKQQTMILCSKFVHDSKMILFGISQIIIPSDLHLVVRMNASIYENGECEQAHNIDVTFYTLTTKEPLRNLTSQTNSGGNVTTYLSQCNSDISYEIIEVFRGDNITFRWNVPFSLPDNAKIFFKTDGGDDVFICFLNTLRRCWTPRYNNSRYHANVHESHTFEMIIEHSKGEDGAIYGLEITGDSEIPCLSLILNITVLDPEPVCSVFFLKESRYLKFHCGWLEKYGRVSNVHLMIGNETLSEYNTNATVQPNDRSRMNSDFSLTVSLDNMFHGNAVPDRCVVTEQDSTRSCTFSNFTTSVKNGNYNRRTLSFQFHCCSISNSCPNVWLYSYSNKDLQLFDI